MFALRWPQAESDTQNKKQREQHSTDDKCPYCIPAHLTSQGPLPSISCAASNHIYCFLGGVNIQLRRFRTDLSSPIQL